MFKNFPTGGYEDYLKFKDGTSFQGVFRGDAHEYYAIFKDRTEYTDWAKGRSFKFKVNFIVKEDGQWTAKVLQGGRKLQAQINSEVSESGLDNLYRIKRTGMSKDDTTYTCIAMGQVDPEDLKAINSITLKPLTTGRKRAEEEIPPPSDEDFNPETDIPEDPESAPF